jgi:hypothetical protein
MSLAWFRLWQLGGPCATAYRTSEARDGFTPVCELSMVSSKYHGSASQWASIGRRPFSRGYCGRTRDPSLRTPGFNWATTFQPWIPVYLRIAGVRQPILQLGHDLSAVDTWSWQGGSRSCTRFNCATTFQPWTPLILIAVAVLVKELQLGHDLSAVDTNTDEQHVAEKQHASIGPRPFSRGYVRSRTPCQSFGCMLQLGHDLSAVDTSDPARRGITPPRASIGPRPFSRGYVTTWFTTEFAENELQLGHDLSAVDARVNRAIEYCAT